MQRVNSSEFNGDFDNLHNFDPTEKLDPLFGEIADDFNAPISPSALNNLALENNDDELTELNSEDDAGEPSNLVEEEKRPATSSSSPEINAKNLVILCSKQLNQFLRIKKLSLEEIKSKFIDALTVYSEYCSGRVFEENIDAKIKMIPRRFKNLFETYNHQTFLPILFHAINNYTPRDIQAEFVFKDTRGCIPSNPASQRPLNDRITTLLHRTCCNILLTKLRGTGRRSFTEDEITNAKDALVNAINSNKDVPSILVKYFNTYSQKQVQNAIFKFIERYKPKEQFKNSVVDSVKPAARSRKNSKPKERKRKSSAYSLANLELETNLRSQERDNLKQQDFQTEIVSVMTDSSGQEVTIIESGSVNNALPSNLNPSEAEKVKFEQTADSMETTSSLERDKRAPFSLQRDKSPLLNSSLFRVISKEKDGKANQNNSNELARTNKP